VSPPFGSMAIANLRARTEYEAWLLEDIYKLTDGRQRTEHVDDLVFPPDGGPPKHTVFATANLVVGDWRPQFIGSCAPLILVTTFKLLDMLMEWILIENGHAPTFRFSAKIQQLKRPHQFPHPMAGLEWWCERVTALYGVLEPLRGTIIHAPHFESKSGALDVSVSSRKGLPATTSLAVTDLRNLALLLVSTIRHVEKAWSFDLFAEKRVRWILDQLTRLHRGVSLGQRQPVFINTRVYMFQEDPIVVDLGAIRREVVRKLPSNDAVFDLYLIVINDETRAGRAFRIPSDELEREAGSLRRVFTDLQAHEVPVAADVDIESAIVGLRKPRN
jgi:hypothetical protein